VPGLPLTEGDPESQTEKTVTAQFALMWRPGLLAAATSTGAPHPSSCSARRAAGGMDGLIKQ